jgi:hypothetical protein
MSALVDITIFVWIDAGMALPDANVNFLHGEAASF